MHWDVANMFLYASTLTEKIEIVLEKANIN